MLSDRYELLRTLGEGSAGTVYLARDREAGRTVAVKLLKTRSTVIPQAVERFRQEARTLAQVESPHVVRVLDFGQAADGLYLVMEYAEGRNLATLIAEEGPQPAERAARILADVARGLEAIHAQGVIHRDLKPGNVILDAQGSPRIADFGLAKPIRGSDVQTRSGMILGTPGFLAPEILKGHVATPAADLYALGVMAHYLLQGSIPFEGEDHATIFQAQLRGVTAARREALPPGLRNLIQALTRRNPDDRPSAAVTAEAFAGARFESQGVELTPELASAASVPGAPGPPRPHLTTATFRRRGLHVAALASGLLAVGLYLVAGPRPATGPQPTLPVPPAAPGAPVAESQDAAVERLLGELDAFDLDAWVQGVAAANFAACPGQSQRDEPELWKAGERARTAARVMASPWVLTLEELRARVTPGWWRQLPDVEAAAARREALAIRRWLQRRLLEVARLNALDVAMGGPGDLVPHVGPMLAPVHRASVRLDVDQMGHQVPGVETLDTRCFFMSDHPDSPFLETTLIMPSSTSGEKTQRYCYRNRDASQPFRTRLLPLAGARARRPGLAGVVVGVMELSPFATLEARFLDDGGRTLATAFVHTRSLKAHHRTSIVGLGWQGAQVELLVDATLLDGRAEEVEVRYRDLLGELTMCADYHHYCGALGFGWVEGVAGAGFAGTMEAPGVTR